MYLVYLRHVFILIRIEFGSGPVSIPICLNVQRYRNGFSKIYLWGLKDISLPIKSTGFPHNRPYLLNYLTDFTKISFTSFTFLSKSFYNSVLACWVVTDILHFLPNILHFMFHFLNYPSLFHCFVRIRHSKCSNFGYF